MAIKRVLCLVIFLAVIVFATTQDSVDQAIQEYQAKILQLERSIRDVKANTAELDRTLSVREKSYHVCAQYLSESYARLADAGIHEYDQLIDALGVKVDRVFPVYKDLTKKTCSHETYIASLPGHQITTSSVYNKHSDGTHSYLHYKQSKPWEREAWIPKQSDKNPWIQVDLGTEKDIFALGYAGEGDRIAYVKKFNVSYSNDGQKWTFMDKTFKGLSKESNLEDTRKLAEDSLKREIVIHEFEPMIKARYVRLHPIDKYWLNAVRWELYGPKCIDNGEMGYVASRNGDGLWGQMLFSLLHGSLAWSAPNDKSNNHWAQMDFGINRLVNAVASQGKREKWEWVTAFTLKYRNETTKQWVDYNKGYTFNGNFDQNTVVVHPLEFPFEARYVRIYAKTWNNFPSLRWELYGPSKSDFPKRLCLW